MKFDWFFGCIRFLARTQEPSTAGGSWSRQFRKSSSITKGIHLEAKVQKQRNGLNQRALCDLCQFLNICVSISSSIKQESLKSNYSVLLSSTCYVSAHDQLTVAQNTHQKVPQNEDKHMQRCRKGKRENQKGLWKILLMEQTQQAIHSLFHACPQHPRCTRHSSRSQRQRCAQELCPHGTHVLIKMLLLLRQPQTSTFPFLHPANILSKEKER